MLEENKKEHASYLTGFELHQLIYYQIILGQSKQQIQLINDHKNLENEPTLQLIAIIQYLLQKYLDQYQDLNQSSNKQLQNKLI